MPEPEISRRCRSCGVSIRVRASFCPQCGNPLSPKPVATGETDDTAPLTPDLTQDLTKDNPESAATKPLTSKKKGVRPTVFANPSAAVRKKPRQATVGMVHPTERLRRDVKPSSEGIGDDGLNRVEKFRQISSAMIDEAAYDPSLRFLLVAAVLFVLFVVLVLVSELIR